MVKDLTAKKWIEDHFTPDSEGNYSIPQIYLDKCLNDFELPHIKCCYIRKGLCNSNWAPKPGHSRCIGTWKCTEIET